MESDQIINLVIAIITMIGTMINNFYTARQMSQKGKKSKYREEVKEILQQLITFHMNYDGTLARQDTKMTELLNKVDRLSDGSN